MSDIRTEIVEVTPEMAKDFLSRNSKNRRVIQKRVEDLAREMEAGRFRFNGDSIRIDDEGVMLDGQHRCHACVVSGIPFTSIVVTGLPRSVMPTIDQHSKRTTGQVLGIHNIPNANATAAIVRLCVGMATGQRRSTRLTSTEVLEILGRHPGMVESASRCRRSFPKCGTIIGAVHYIACFLGKDEDAESFVTVWESGVPHYRGCAAHIARERAIRSDASTFKMTPTDLEKMIVGAWNNFERRSPVSKAVIPSDPRIKGWSLDEVNSIGPGGAA